MPMTDAVERLAEARKPDDAQPAIDDCLQKARSGQLGVEDRRAFLHNLILNQHFLAAFSTSQALDYLFSAVGADEWRALFGEAAEKEVPRILVEVVERQADVGHAEVLRLIPSGDTNALLAAVRQLNAHLEKIEGSPRLLRGMRVARIQADIYRLLAADPKIWRRRKMPPCCIDGDEIARLKEKKDAVQVAQAYEGRVNQLQRIDLRRSLAQVQQGPADRLEMRADDFESTFSVNAPLRLGLSSANASDNHIRSKEQGGKTLNAGIDLSGSEGEPAPPLSVAVRRLPEPRLVLRSLSSDFKADFEANARGNAESQSELFFAYRRGGDESLRMVKQALVHTGIVRADSIDVMGDVSAFTGGGGLEVTTSCQVLQGSGLGTSSILAAAILKALYRVTGHPAGRAEGEYPALYDQSVLLEQSIGLNSGWQDARGACGGTSAVKDFYAAPTEGLPAPRLSFVDIDEETFTQRVVLFDTGISRAATRGLNVVLDVYLTRDRDRYPAIRASLAIHDEMVESLRHGDYSRLGQLATRYWQLRCQLDPGATSEALQVLFEDPELANLSEGGTLTGAGGGGFAVLLAKEGAAPQLRQQLTRLQERQPYTRSAVVDYRLNRTGLQLSEQ